MLHKAVQFKAEEVTDAGVFTGYASVFGNKDLGGDIVLPGAFKQTLFHHKGKFPLLADHKPTLSDRLGVVEASEDARGLMVKGYFNLEKQKAREVYSDLKQAQEHGLGLGMSFGYDAVKHDFDRDKGARLLKEIKLYEVTLTQFPMNEAAGVVAVKASDFIQTFNQALTQHDLEQERWRLQDALHTAIRSALEAGDETAAERLDTIRISIEQYRDAFLAWAARMIDMSGGKAVEADPLTKQIMALVQAEARKGTQHDDGAGDNEMEALIALELKQLRDTILTN